VTELAKTSDRLSFPALVQLFFTDYLLRQRALSPNTIAAYRDAMMLFLDFAEQRLGKAASTLRLSDFEPALILAFLDDLEQQRHNCVRSRNLRLMALRAFLKFAARRDLTGRAYPRASPWSPLQAQRASHARVFDP
jgi:site-specific recombinase XerD